MQPPVIGLNMDYTCYPKYPAGDPQFRDCYDIYAPYVDMVAAAGGIPLPIPPVGNVQLLEEYLERVDGFVFTGGEDYPPEFYGEKPQPHLQPAHPRRCQADIHLARWVLASDMPVLGICGGLQLINIALGGKLIQHLDSVNTHKAASFTKDASHAVTLIGGTTLSAVFKTGRLRVNSAHHQAVHPDHIGTGLRVAALAPDGVIEALETVGKRFLVGVQWHPERMAEAEQGRLIFYALISACIRKAGASRKIN
ncbi:MAG: gamma-glutamyl-gamma-aminobutyrate hydrolase family protein [Thermodesulfobacteriota bacterium]